MKPRKILLVAAFLAAVTFGTPVPAQSQTGARGACESYCAAIAAGCYIFFGILVKEACAMMYEGCVDGCYAALIHSGQDSDEDRISGGGGGF